MTVTLQIRSKVLSVSAPVQTVEAPGWLRAMSYLRSPLLTWTQTKFFPWVSFRALCNTTHFPILFYLLKKVSIKKQSWSKARSQKITLLSFMSTYSLSSRCIGLAGLIQPLQLTTKRCSDFCSLWTWSRKINWKSKRSHSPQASTTCRTKMELQMLAHSEIKPPTAIKIIS